MAQPPDPFAVPDNLWASPNLRPLSVVCRFNGPAQLPLNGMAYAITDFELTAEVVAMAHVASVRFSIAPGQGLVRDIDYALPLRKTVIPLEPAILSQAIAVANDLVREKGITPGEWLTVMARLNPNTTVRIGRTPIRLWAGEVLTVSLRTADGAVVTMGNDFNGRIRLLGVYVVVNG